MPGEVLLDAGCSRDVRTAVQSVLRNVPVRVCDVGQLVESTPAVLARAPAVLIGLRNRQGLPTVAAVEKIRAVAPHLGVFVIEDLREALDLWLPRLAASGVDDAFALDRAGDDKELHAVVANRVALSSPELALRQLQSLWASCPVRQEALYCVRNGYRPRRRFDPHAWLLRKPRSLRTMFERAGMPTPLFLSRFGRELHWQESAAIFSDRRVELAMLLGFDTVEQVGIERRRLRRAAEEWPELYGFLR